MSNLVFSSLDKELNEEFANPQDKTEVKGKNETPTVLIHERSGETETEASHGRLSHQVYIKCHNDCVENCCFEVTSTRFYMPGCQTGVSF